MKCVICDSELSGRQKKYCSVQCKGKDNTYRKRSEASKQSSRRATKRLRLNRQRLRNEIFGTSCYICDSEIHLILHKKDGEEHHVNGQKTIKEALENPDEFVRVCMKCYIAIHWIMKWYKMTWEEIIAKLK